MSDSPQILPTLITRKLRKLDRMIRTYVALDGATTSLAAIAALLFADFLFDRFFEFSRTVRVVLLPVLLAAGFAIIWQRMIRRVFAGLRKEQLAMVLERYVPGLNESLITAVELGHSHHTSDVDPGLLSQTVHNAAHTLRNTDLRPFFRYGRLAARIALTLFGLGAAVACCAAFSETTELWFSRNVLLSDRDWPRRSLLVVDGFQNGYVRIGRGDSFTLNVRAHTGMPLVPETVRLRIGSGKTGSRTILLDQFRTEGHDGTDWRIFSHTFSEMLETVPLTVRGADSFLENLLIEVVPQPVLTGVRARLDFPDYMDRTARIVPPSSRMLVPEGSAVTISAQASKPLLKVDAVVNRGEPLPLRNEPEASAFDSLEFSLPDLREETLLEFQLLDIDKLRNRQPIRIEFSIVKDQPPVVNARLDGIGGAVTPVAVLPTLGEITDDNGIASLRYRYMVERLPQETAPDGEEPETNPPAEEGTIDISGVGKSQTVFALDRSFSLSALNLVSGDKLKLQVEATDRFDLDGGDTGQTGTGPQWNMEIVTPERLRSLLEVREIALRQRFEVLIGEVDRTKSLIDDCSLDPDEELIREAEALTLPNGTLTDAEESERVKELETRKKNLVETIPQEQAVAALYNISRALRDTQKEVYDLRTLVESFLLIRREMVNNQIFSEDAERRLDRGIIGPIRSLADSDFPEADRLTDLLRKTLETRDAPLRPEALRQRKEILDQFDLVLKKMYAIRDNMVSMESFNEAIEILRAIIRQQQELRKETLDRKNRRLKDLLE